MTANKQSSLQVFEPEDWTILRATVMSFVLDRFKEHMKSKLWRKVPRPEQQQIIVEELIEKFGGHLSMFTDNNDGEAVKKRILDLVIILWPTINSYISGSGTALPAST